MSLKLKSFNNFGNVQNVNDDDKKISAPICIDLDDDSNDKIDELNEPSGKTAANIGCSNEDGSEILNTSREVVIYNEDVDSSICKDNIENKVNTDCLNGSIIIVDNDGVAVVKKILNKVVDDSVNEAVNDASAKTRIIVVDSDGVAIVKKATNISPDVESSENNEVDDANAKTPYSDSLRKGDASIAVEVDPETHVHGKNKGVIVAPTIVLEEDTSTGDVVQVHEIDVDGDIVQVQEIAFDDIDRVLENKFNESVEDYVDRQMGMQEDDSEAIPERGQLGEIQQRDEIVIISDKESEQRSQPEDTNEEETEEKLSKISENVTVLKTPLRIKKNKRMIKSPFKRTNDLLCQKVDKMIRCGQPDIQLLRSLLNHLSENNIGGLLAKLVSSEELETMRTNFETIQGKDEALGDNASLEDSDEKDTKPSSPVNDLLHKKAVDVCSKLPDGITVNVVSNNKVDGKDDQLNSVDMIDNIIQSEVSAAQSAGTASSRSGIPLNSRSDSIVELDVTPPPTPVKVATPAVGGGLRIANIKTLLAPKDDIIIPEISKQSTIRISDTVSLSKHVEDDDISIIEENLSPATITRNLPNVSISRSLPPQAHQASQPRHPRNTSTVPSHHPPPKSSPPSQYPKPPNTYYDGRGKLRSSLSHKLVRPNLEQPTQNQPQNSNSMPIPMNELIRRYLYPSGTGGVSVGTQMENPWGLPRDLAMYEELLRTNMTTTTDNSQYAAYAAAYEELIKSYMSSSPENYARIVAKYNIFSTDRTDRPHSDHNRPSTSRLTPQTQTGLSGQGTTGGTGGQTSRLSPHQRTPVIVSAASLKSKAEYKECSIGSGVTLAPVRDGELEPQPGPSGVGEKSVQRSARKRNYKESSEESTSEESSEEDEGPSADEFVMEQAETDRMKAGRSRRRETDITKKRRKGDRSREKEVIRSREDGGGVCSKRRGKVTAMRHNPVRKGQVTVESTDSEDDAETAKRKRAMKAYKEARRGAIKAGKKLKGRGSSSEDENKSRRQLFVEENSNSASGFPRKTNINKAALKMNRIDSDSNESWKKTGSSQEDLSSDEN